MSHFHMISAARLLIPSKHNKLIISIARSLKDSEDS